MKDNESKKGMWKRTFAIFKGVKLPYGLYLVQILLGIISAKVSLMYMPYYTKMQIGYIDDMEVVMLYVGFLTLSTVMSLMSAIPAFYASGMVSRRIKNKLIRKILHLPMDRFEQEKPARLITRVTQDEGYASMLLSSICSFFISFASTIMTFLEMNTIDNFLSYILVPVVIYVIFAAWVEGRLTFLGNRRERKAMAHTTAFFAEHTAYLLNIKQLNAQKDENALGRKAIDEMYKADIYYAVLRFFAILVSSSTSKVITILVFVLGAAKVRSGEMNIEELVVFYNFINLAYNNLIILPSMYQTLMTANGYLFYVGQLVVSPSEQIRREIPMQEEAEDIVFENVSFSYTGEREILKDVSMRIPKGKTTAIVGPNGCGKSTAFKLLERFYEPQQGRVLFGDTDSKTIHLDQWRRNFGFVLQKPQLFNSTIRENICYGVDREVSDEELARVAKLACAYNFITENPEGFDFVIGDNGCRLSEGQKQRIAIARTILVDPKYLLLDEATSNMDVYAKEEVLQGLDNMMEGRTTVFISHDADMIRRADHVIVLNNGSVCAQGTQEEVAASSGLYRCMMAAGTNCGGGCA